MADHGCNGTITSVGVLYVDDRGAADGNVWVYLESNGSSGLQSGGEHVSGLYEDECSHSIPDMLLY